MKIGKRTMGLLLLVCLLVGPVLVLSAGAQGESGTTAGGDDIIIVKAVLGEHASSPIDPDAPVYQEITRKTGIKLDIEAIPDSDFRTKRNLLLATNQVPDILEMGLAQAQDFADSGAIAPLMDLIDEYAPNAKALVESEPEVRKVILDGELWYMPVWDLRKKMNAPVPNIRRDLLEDNGLEMPDTFDDLYEVLKRLKEIYPSSMPWTTRGGTKNLLNRSAYPMGMGYNIHYNKDTNGGAWVYGTIRPEFKDILVFFNKLYTEKLLDPDFAINTADQWHQKLGSGKSFFYYDNMTFAVNYTLALRTDKPDATFWPVPVMENPKGQRNNFFYPRHHVQNGYAIGANSDYPERIMEMFNWMLSPEGYSITNWGIEGVHYTREEYLFSGAPEIMYSYDGDKGGYEVLPEIIAEYKNASDPQRAMRSTIGTGLLQFTICTDQKPIYYYDPPIVDDWYAQLNDDPGMLEFVREPVFTVDERELLKKYKTEVDIILLPALDRFIIGTLPLSDFDSIAQQAVDAGALEIEKIYNQAEARSK
jgi:putative aldouronate transport system substrate-binding protein